MSRKAIRIIVPSLDMYNNEQRDGWNPRQPFTALFDRPLPTPPRRAQRTNRATHPRSLLPHEGSQTGSFEIVPGFPVPAPVAKDTPTPRSPRPIASPSFRNAPSPSSEPVLIPSGSVQMPSGSKPFEAGGAYYQARSPYSEDDEQDGPNVLERMGNAMFKGLKKLPTAFSKATRLPEPRNEGEDPSMPNPFQSEQEREPVQPSQEMPVQDDVETYVTPNPGEDEPPDVDEQQLYEYFQRKRMRRDGIYRQRRRRGNEARYVPTSQMMPVAEQTPAGLAVASQPAQSQAGVSDVRPASVDPQLEAQELRQEREDLERAQERERARNVYAAEAVRPPAPSETLPPQQDSSLTGHRRAASLPMLPSRVFSRWSAERDMAGRRLENRSEGGFATTSLIDAFLRLIQHIRDMPWVGDRIAADYVPGGVKPKSTSSRYYPPFPRSETGFSSPYVHSGVDDGAPYPFPDASPASFQDRTGRSWYTAMPAENILVVPEGSAPPPGFMPYPFPVPHHLSATPAPEVEGDEPAVGGVGSTSSHTHVETPPQPIPAAAGAGAPDAPSLVSGSGYRDGIGSTDTYQYLSTDGSKTGVRSQQPYLFVPSASGRRQPLFIPELGRGPAFVYSHPGPPKFVPVSR